MNYSDMSDSKTDDILDKLQSIFRDVFDDSTLVLSVDISSDDIDGWDSLAQINIITACESEFGVKFGLNDIVNISNVGDLAGLIEEKSKKG